MEGVASAARQAGADTESARAEHLREFAVLTDGATGMGSGDVGGFTDMAATEGLAQTMASIGAEIDLSAQHSHGFGVGVDSCVLGGKDTLNNVCNMLKNA